MRDEESGHRRALTDIYRERFGDHIDTPFLQAAFQVVIGGVLVFLSGILIGSA
jgi:hypothetical protein